MLPFRRKSEDEEERDEGKGLKKKETPLRRGSGGARKKEPPKPWGKKERYLVLMFLLGSVFVAGVLAMSARSWKLPNVPRVKMPNFSFSETYVFEGEKMTNGYDEVIGEFRDMTRGLSGVYGFYVYRSGRDESYGYLADEEFTAASLIKLPVMSLTLEEIEKGNLERDEEIIESLRSMGKESNNLAYLEMKELLGEDYLNNYIVEIGMRYTDLFENTTTPRDMGIFFQKLWNGRLLNEEHTDELMEYLTDTIYEDWITLGVPDSIDVAHKFGREVHVVNDAGIVMIDKPYVVVIMSKGVVESEADEIIPELSELIYDFEVEN